MLNISLDSLLLFFSLQSWFWEALCHGELRLLLWLKLQVITGSIACLLELLLKCILLQLYWWYDAPSWIRCNCHLSCNLIPWNPCLRCSCCCCVLLQKIRLESKSSLSDQLHFSLLHFPCIFCVTQRSKW